jgi:hypothetical protein
VRVLVACEFSGVVRDAFIRNGHDAWSCDFLKTERPGPHLQGDAIFVAFHHHWDLMIAHPPCTYLTNAGAKHLYLGGKAENGKDEERWELMRKAAKFFRMLWEMENISKVCIENPIMHGHARALVDGPYAQIIQPWQFGHAETKATCLWLRGLPKLVPTKIMPPPHKPRVHHESPGPDRWKNRSRTLEGIAQAMADQWGGKR